MKKYLVFPVLMILFSIQGCSLFDSLVPDVDTEYSKSFPVNITENEGHTESELVDVTSSPDYNDFKDHIDGFKINRITWEITDFNAPDDMYVSGVVNAWDIDSVTSIEVANISRENLSVVAAAGEQDNIEEIANGTDKIAAWLKKPGSFYYNASYKLTNAEGKPYDVTGQQYSFRLRLTYYVTVQTGAK